MARITKNEALILKSQLFICEKYKKIFEGVSYEKVDAVAVCLIGVFRS